MKAIRLYSQVLVDVAMAPNSNVVLSVILKELEEFSRLITEEPRLIRIFDNPTLGEEEKQKVLKAFIAKLALSEITARFLGLLVKRARVGIIHEILNEVQTIETERKGGLIGELVSAVAITDEELAGIKSAISKRLNKPVKLKQKIDSSLIAGMRVTVAGVTYDGSVRGKLDKLADSI